MKKRPPLLGYNHNVRHGGRLFHVQTEDSGPVRAALTTHVFFKGTILATSRSTYRSDDPEEQVQKQMQDQHKRVLKQLRDGHLDARAESLGSHTKDPLPESPGASLPATAPVVQPETKPLVSPVATQSLAQRIDLVLPFLSGDPTDPDIPIALVEPSVPKAQTGNLLHRVLERLDAEEATAATTAPYAQRAHPQTETYGHRPLQGPDQVPLSQKEMAALLDDAAGTVENNGFSPSSGSGKLVGESAEEGPVLEFLAEPASEDELEAEAPSRQVPEIPAKEFTLASGSQRTPTRITKPSQRSPRQVSAWLGQGANPDRAFARTAAAEPTETSEPPSSSVPPVATAPGPEMPPRVRLIPARSTAGPPRALRVTAQRLEAVQPRPTAEGVLVKRPNVIPDRRHQQPSAHKVPRIGTGGTDPRLPPLAEQETPSLDQVILAYLAEDNQKKPTK